MEVILDGERNFALEGEPPDALSVVVAISEYLREQGRSIMSVTLDGAPIEPDDLVTALEDKPLDEVGAIEITSETVAALVAQCVAELETVLPELPQACRHLAELFHSEQPGEGFEPFTELAGIWEHIKQQELLILNALELDPEGEMLNGQSLAALHEDLNAQLREAVTALEKEDTVLLGDLLEYELAPRAEREIEIVALLKERAPRSA